MTEQESEALIEAIQEGTQNEWVEAYAQAQVAKEIEIIARKWQNGEWSMLTPIINDPSAMPIQRILGSAQAVTDWLRSRVPS